MKFFSIDKFFKLFAEFQTRHRKKILALFLFLDLLSLLGLGKIVVSDDVQASKPNEKTLKAEEKFFKTFPNESIYVLVSSDDVFSSQTLKVIDKLGRRLETEVPTASSVYSLLTMTVPVGSEDGIEIKNPFDGKIPDAPKKLKEIKDFFLSRESLVNVFVSADATETWLILPLPRVKDDRSLRNERIRAAQKIIQEVSKECQGVCSLNPVGWNYSAKEASDYAIREALTRISIGFAVMLFMLIFLLRSLRGVAFSLLSAFLGIASVLGLSSYLGFPINANAISLPILLGMALSIGYSLHVINSFKRHFRRTGKRIESVILMAEETGWSLFFTVATTVASLISFLFFDMEILRCIGGISAGIVFSVYLHIALVIPIVMSFGKDQEEMGVEKAKTATGVDLAFERAGLFVVQNKIPVAVISAAIMIFLAFGIRRISVNMDLFEMQGPKVPHIARAKELLSHELGSIYSFDVMISFDDPENPEAFFEPDNLLRLEKMVERLGNLRLVKKSMGKPRVLSPLSMLKEINRMFNGDKEEFYRINTDDGVPAQTLVFWSNSFREYFDVDNDDYGVVRLHLELTGFDSKKLLADVADIEEIGKEIFPDANVYSIGRVIDYARTNDVLVELELKSLMISFLIIAFMLAAAFANATAGLIAMIPNIAPIVTLAGIMGYLGQPLDILTVTVMPMVLGLAVDDTIHLTNHIKKDFLRTGSYMEAVKNSFGKIAKTMFMTSAILCAMFAVYLFSPMRFFTHTGFLAIVGISSALLADYTLTPAVICIAKPFGKEVVHDIHK